MQEQSLEQILSKIDKKISSINPINVEDVPTVPLYMDQLTTFMDSKLRAMLRCPSEDKVLTKTMINNYAKNDLIPPPIKKRYSKDHLYELLFIFYFKNFMSIGDIQTLLSPITSEFFGKSKEKGFGIEDIYVYMTKVLKGSRTRLREELKKDFDSVENAFDNVPEDKREYLKKFAFICELSYDIYLKKFIIEQMVDEISDDYILERESSYDDEMRKKAAKEATMEAMRIAKLKADKAKASEKLRREKMQSLKYSSDKFGSKKI
ncbi:MAG: DUF1836 domain-containing protein [Lachnospiraceae bacterium]|nr:DUF1836 domain-containing protein [Lachnospiraceae bacterium]